MRLLWVMLACLVLFPPLPQSVFAAGPEMGKNSGLIDNVAFALDDSISSSTPALRAWEADEWRAWPRLAVGTPGGGWLLVEAPEFMSGAAEHLPGGGFILSGRNTLGAKLHPINDPKWKEEEGGLTLLLLFNETVELKYTATASPGRVVIQTQLLNNSDGPLLQVEEMSCISPTPDSGFLNRDPLSSHLLLDGNVVSWDRVMPDLSGIWKPGMDASKGWQWLKAPVRGAPLPPTPTHPQFAPVSGKADAAVLIQDSPKDPAHKVVLVAEPGASVFKNCWSGCIHANPWLGDVDEAGFGRAKLAIFFSDAPDAAERIAARLREHR